MNLGEHRHPRRTQRLQYSREICYKAVTPCCTLNQYISHQRLGKKSKGEVEGWRLACVFFAGQTGETSRDFDTHVPAQLCKMVDHLIYEDH